MKVGLLMGTPTPEAGGAYTFENEIFQALVELGAESGHTFVIFSWFKRQQPELSFKHIQFELLHRKVTSGGQSKLEQNINGIIRKIRHPRSQFKVENSIEEFLPIGGVDIILYLDTFAYLTSEIPYITVVWDLQHRLQPYFPEVSLNGAWDGREQAYKTQLQRASFIVTGTEIGKAEISHFYQIPAERIKVLPFPTPKFVLEATPTDCKQVLAKYNIPEGYLFYPAQFWPHKNHAGLLLAVKLLFSQYNLAFSVVFVGSDKGNQQYIRELVDELNLSAQVYFLGFVPQSDLISLYRNALALTFVTFFGPDNLPPLEAMALGCPVIASNVSGAREQLGDAAKLVDPKDEKQIALAIKSIYQDLNLRQTLIQSGLERAARFTSQDYIKGIFGIIDDFEPIRRCWSRTNPYRLL